MALAVDTMDGHGLSNTNPPAKGNKVDSVVVTFS